MKKSLTQNTFELLIMDLHPLETPNTVYTNALNATIITRDGNEGVLLNDMGNGRVETAYLPEGYIPLGTCSLGGIIYVACYNPLTDKGQIGCFPSPERNVSSDEVTDLDVTLSNNDFKWEKTGTDKEGKDISTAGAEVYYLKKGLFLEEFTFNPGDKFIVYGNPLSDNFEKLWIEEEYDDFFGKGTEAKLEPFIEDKPNSEDDDYSHVYDGSDEKYIYYYPPTITEFYYDTLPNNESSDNCGVATPILNYYQKWRDNDEEYTINIGDEGDDAKISYELIVNDDFSGSLEIDENGLITYTTEDAYLPCDIGIIKVTIKMNGKTSSATTTLSLEGMDPKEISMGSLSGNISYSYDGSTDKTVSIDGQSGELALYMIDTQTAKFDFSHIEADVVLKFDDGMLKETTLSCSVENLTICDYKKPDGNNIINVSNNSNIITLTPNGYGKDAHIDNNQLDIYRYFEEYYSNEFNDHFITPNDDLPMQIPFYKVCAFNLSVSYKGVSSNIDCTIYAIPEKIYHAVGPQGTNKNQIHVPYSLDEFSRELVVSNTIHVDVSSIENMTLTESNEDKFEEWVDNNLPIIYSGKIDEQKLPLGCDYGYFGNYVILDLAVLSDQAAEDEHSYIPEYAERPYFYPYISSSSILDWNTDNAIEECDDEANEDCDDTIKADLSDDIAVFFNNNINENTSTVNTNSNCILRIIFQKL